MSVLLEFSMTPLDKGESVSPYVSRSLDIIDKSGVSYRLGPMGTCLEGEWDEVMGVVKSCLDTMRSDCNRVSVTIKMDIRQGATERLTGKIESVEKKLGRPVNK
ncbi:MAG: MTH1187 family thiamine-binding protein [Magnetococcales bacterium]|nr:MTH1187 family thiamine-binding protein [Magnetococcales bacterium]